MKHNETLLSRLEQLPELREQATSGTTKQQASVRARIRNIEKLEPTLEEIITCLEEQRAETEDFGGVTNLRQLTEYTRRSYLSSQSATVERNMQLSFSLPEDFHEAEEDLPDNKRAKLPLFVVIQPELISDDFMYALELMPKGLSQKERVAKKIAAIQKIKEYLVTAIPFQIGKRKSGRILCINRPGDRNNGKYIVFQEINEKQTDTADKSQYTGRMSPRLYGSVYSFIRGQYRALGTLEKKHIFLREIRNHDIPRIRSEWKDSSYSDEKRRLDIATIIAKLRGKISYNEERALEDRLEKITFDHSERDMQRLIGALNDISREIDEKIGKKGEIWKQAEKVDDITTEVESMFYRFFGNIMKYIETMDQGELIKKVTTARKQQQELAPISQFAKNELGRMHSFIRAYIREVKSEPFIGHPFSTFHHTVEQHLKNLPERVNLDYIRTTLSLILTIKQFAHDLMMMQVEHHEKTIGEAPYPSSSEKNFLFVQQSFQKIYFLPNIPLGKQAQEKFKKMKSDIDAIVENIPVSH